MDSSQSAFPVRSATVQVIQASDYCKDQDCDDLVWSVGLFPQTAVLVGVFPEQGSSLGTVFALRLPDRGGCRPRAVSLRARRDPAGRSKRLPA